MKQKLLAAASAVVFSLTASGSVLAESFDEALAKAYMTNPTLQAQRAAVRGTDEDVPQALSNWRPTVELNGSVGRVFATSNSFNPNDQNRTERSVDFTIEQPIFRGWRTVRETEQAENNVLASRADLTDAEQDVLLAAATAYLDVLRDIATLDLNRNNELVLRRQLQAAQDRFSVGEITRTDVSQSEARLAQSAADRIQAEGNLEQSRAAYRNAVGDLPGTLEQVPEIGGIPATEDEALAIALGTNPSVASADFSERAARENIGLVRGELLPEVSLVGQWGRDIDTANNNSKVTELEVRADVSVPLYQAGDVYSRLREAKQVAGQRRQELDEAKRNVAEDVKRAWEDLVTARARIQAFNSQIESNTIALDGVRRENAVGARTILDVLDQEQELLDSQVNLVRAVRDEKAAALQVRAAMGTLTAVELALPVEIYDPMANYRRVRGKWFGGDIKED
ncbi:TolC family outer membrane protein [Alphaproteobacteria bacterium HT1-32]|nr:TolC family outer membrane protein [Alphaproteobacteria bacterium HT1-32]